MMKTLDVKSYLPHEMRISSAGQHLYSIGLTPYRNGCDRKSRPALSHPIIAFAFNAFFIFKHIIYLLIYNKLKDHKFLVYWGDVGALINMQHTCTLIITIIWGLAIVTQVLHHDYHWRGRQPNYLGVFNMMSGMITPYSIGLTDEKTVRTLLRRSRIAFKFIRILKYGVAINAVLFILAGYFINFELKDLIYGN